MQPNDAQRLRSALEAADLVLIGASNGIDMAEGLNVFRPDAHFQQAYGDLSPASSILEGLYNARGSLTATWAWAARFAVTEWLNYEPGPLMATLRELIGETDTFVLTCNLNGHFARAGFAHVMETEGSLTAASCSCHDARYSLADTAHALNASISEGHVDAARIPVCPRCGTPLRPALDEARLHRPDQELRESIAALNALLATHRGGNIVVLELGVGLRNGVIKRILHDAVHNEPRLTYAIFNYNQAVTPPGLADKTLLFDGDMAAALQSLSSTP